MADGAGDGSSNIFAKVTIFFGARTPDRNKYIEKARVNGANVVPLEAKASVLIADCERRHLNPPGAVSYTWIDDSIAAGVALDIKDYSAAPLLVSAHRPVGALRPAKQSRAPFTHADDVELYNWVQTAKRRGESVKGNEIYKQLEKKNKRHPYQSWRDRYIKYLADRPPAGARVSDGAPSSSPAASRTSSAVPQAGNVDTREATLRESPGLPMTGTPRPVVVLPSFRMPTALKAMDNEQAANETIEDEEPSIDEEAIAEALLQTKASVDAAYNQTHPSNDQESQATASPEPDELMAVTQEEDNEGSGKPGDVNLDTTSQHSTGRISRPVGWRKGDGPYREFHSSDANNDIQQDSANNDETQLDQDTTLPGLDLPALPENLPGTVPTLTTEAPTQPEPVNNTFTEAEHDDLLAQAEDIEDVAVGKWRVCWRVYAKQHPQHTADEWTTYYETMIRPQYRSTLPEVTTQEHEDELAAQLIDSSLTSIGSPFGSAASPFKARSSIANTKRKRVTSPPLSQEDAMRDGSPSRGSNAKRPRSESVIPDEEEETVERPSVPDDILDIGNSQRLRHDSEESWNGFSPERDVGPDFGIYNDQDESLEDEQENAVPQSQDSQHQDHLDVPGKLQVFGDEPQDESQEQASQDESQEFYDASQGDLSPSMKLVPKVAPIPTPELLKRKSTTLDQVVNSLEQDDDIDSEDGTEDMFDQETEKPDQEWDDIDDLEELSVDDQARVNAQVARETAHLHKDIPSGLRHEIAESEQGDDVETKWPEEEVEEDEELTDEELVQEVFVDEESIEDSEEDNDFRTRPRANPFVGAPSFDSDMILPPDDSVAGDDEDEQPPTPTPRKSTASRTDGRKTPAGSVSDLEDYTIMTLPANSDNGDNPDADNAIPSTEHEYVDTQALLQAETQALDADLPPPLSQDLSQWPPRQLRLDDSIVPSSPAFESLRSPRAAKTKAAHRLRESSSLFINDDDERDENYASRSESPLPPLGDNDEQDDVVVIEDDDVVNDSDTLDDILPGDPGLLIEAWRDRERAAANGDPLDFVDYSLQRTSPALDVDLAALVLASLRAGTGVPRGVKGIWTEEDDKLMLEDMPRGDTFRRMRMITARNRLKALHGEQAYQARLQDLKEYE